MTTYTYTSNINVTYLVPNMFDVYANIYFIKKNVGIQKPLLSGD